MTTTESGDAEESTEPDAESGDADEAGKLVGAQPKERFDEAITTVENV